MAVYGIDFYGVGRFGRDPTIIRPDFSVEPFITTPLDYSTLHVTWVRPQSPDCTNLRLVRMFRNLSQDGGQPPGTTDDASAGADGTVLFTDLVNRAQTYTDSALGSGFVYYTMWGWSNTDQQWVRCSDVIGLVPLNWGYGWRFYNLLPMAYRDRDVVMVDPYNPWPVDGPTPPLQRFLQLVGFQTDFIRTEMESLMSINDPANCSGALLPLMAQQFGLPHEPEIGMQQERELIANAVHLYKYKGSPRGLTEFCSIMTGYPATSLVHHGYNSLLSLDDGIMADSIGTWQPWPPAGTGFPAVTGNQGVALAYNPCLTSGPTSIAAIANTPPMEKYPGLTFGPPYYTDSGMMVNATGPNLLSAENSSFEGGTVGNWVAAANCTVTNQPVGYRGVRALGITATKPGLAQSQALLSAQTVIAGHAYLYTAAFRSATGTNRQVSITVTFFNSGGTNLGAFAGVAQIETPTGWVTANVVATAPTNSATCTVTLNVFGPANGEMHYADFIAAGSGGQDIYITTGGIPITDFMSQFYAAGHATFRFQIWSPVVRQVEVSLWGDNGSGVPVQILPPTGALPQFPEKVNDWQMMTVTGVVNPYPGSLPGDVKPTGPARYYWIYPRIRIIGTGTETHYITLAGLWPTTLDQIGVDTPPYDYPRDTKVVLQPQFSNLLSNTLTTFQRNNPAYPPTLPQMLNIGFDGLSAAMNPLFPAGPVTGNMSIRQQTLEDAPDTVAIHGSAALQMDAIGPGATVWFGQVQQWSPPPTISTGWWVPVSPKPTADWFTGAIPGSATARPWLDPDNPLNPVINSWFVVPEPDSNPPFGLYFGVGTDIVNGLWFNLPPQPPQNGNMTMFNVQNAQPFNFSVYARYITVQDPTNAVMDLGFRWIYADGTYVENNDTTYSVTLTPEYQRFSVAPDNPPGFAYLGEPPVETTTGQYPVGVYPFVRFTRAQYASFLLNGAMLSPTVSTPQYMDATSFSAATGEFLQDPVSGASYYYQRRTPRIARLNAELYRWLPMGATYTINYMSGAIMPALDPTLWTRLNLALVASTSLSVTPS